MCWCSFAPPSNLKGPPQGPPKMTGNQFFRGPGSSRGMVVTVALSHNAFGSHFGRHFAPFWPSLWMISLGVVCMVWFVFVTRYLPKMLQFRDVDTWYRVHSQNVVQNEISSPPHCLKIVLAPVVYFSGIYIYIYSFIVGYAF